MHDDADFLRAILADPFDDAPRLLLADWLEDRAHESGGGERCGGRCNGKGWYSYRSAEFGHETESCDQCSGTGRIPDHRAARAEFIRVQCELEPYQSYRQWLESMPVEQWSGDPEEGVLLRRLDPLVKRHTELCHQYVRDCKTWSKEFISQILGPNWLSASASWQWWWKRGFVASISCTLAAFMTHAAEIFSKHPVTEVRLTDREPASTFGSTGAFWYCTKSAVSFGGTNPHWLPDEFSPMADGIESRNVYGNDSSYWYPTTTLARLALSRACVDHGRSLVELPPLTWPALPAYHSAYVAGRLYTYSTPTISPD